MAFVSFDRRVATPRLDTTHSGTRAIPSRDDMARLDEPCAAIPATAGDVGAAWSSVGRAGQRIIGTASLSRHLRPGAPMRGVYRMHDVHGTSHGQDSGLDVIEQCIAHAATGGGRTLWCHAALAAVDVWRRHGFSVAGPPVATKGGGLGVPMVRRLTPADAAS